jgi:hypothetical protein
MSARQILEHAAGIVDERRAAYGPPDAIMAAIAARWSLTLGRPVTPAQVTLCMIDLKLARLVHDPSYRDGAGGRHRLCRSAARGAGMRRSAPNDDRGEQRAGDQVRQEIWSEETPCREAPTAEPLA